MPTSYSHSSTNSHPICFPNSRPTNLICSTSSRSLPPGTLARDNLFAPSAITHLSNLPEHPFLPADSTRRFASGLPRTQALISRVRSTQHNRATTFNPYLCLVPDSASLHSNSSPDHTSSLAPFAGSEEEGWATQVKRQDMIRQRAIERLRQQREEHRAQQTLFPSPPLRREIQRPLQEHEQRREDAYQREEQARRVSGEQWARRYHYPEKAREEERKRKEQEEREEIETQVKKRQKDIARGWKDFDAITARELERKGYN